MALLGSVAASLSACSFLVNYLPPLSPKAMAYLVLPAGGRIWTFSSTFPLCLCFRATIVGTAAFRPVVPSLGWHTLFVCFICFRRASRIPLGVLWQSVQGRCAYLHTFGFSLSMGLHVPGCIGAFTVAFLVGLVPVSCGGPCLALWEWAICFGFSALEVGWCLRHFDFPACWGCACAGCPSSPFLSQGVQLGPCLASFLLPGFPGLFGWWVSSGGHCVSARHSVCPGGLPSLCIALRWPTADFRHALASPAALRGMGPQLRPIE